MNSSDQSTRSKGLPSSSSSVPTGDLARAQTADTRVQLLLDAFRSRDLAQLTALAEADFDVDTIDLDGRSCLMYAAELGDRDAIRWMLEAGANADLQAPEGRTAIHFAAVNGHREAVGQLLESGAGFEVCDRAGRSPEDLAELAGHPRTAELIREYSAPAVAPLSGGEQDRAERPSRAQTVVAPEGGFELRAPTAVILVAVPAIPTPLDERPERPNWSIEVQGPLATLELALLLSRKHQSQTVFVEVGSDDQRVAFARCINGGEVEVMIDDAEEYSEDRSDFYASVEDREIDDPRLWVSSRLDQLGVTDILSVPRIERR